MWFLCIVIGTNGWAIAELLTEYADSAYRMEVSVTRLLTSEMSCWRSIYIEHLSYIQHIHWRRWILKRCQYTEWKLESVCLVTVGCCLSLCRCCCPFCFIGPNQYCAHGQAAPFLLWQLLCFQCLSWVWGMTKWRKLPKWVTECSFLCRVALLTFRGRVTGSKKSRKSKEMYLH